MRLPKWPTKYYILSFSCLMLLTISVWFGFNLAVPAGSGSVVRDISLPSKSGVKRLAADLEVGGIIRSRLHFMLLGRLTGLSGRLKAGDYRFNNAMTPYAILDKVAKGDVDYRRFTLPEGYSIYQAAELVEQKGYFTKDEFLKACRDQQLLAKLGITAASAEGYLFPATYNLTLSATAEQLVLQMANRFEKGAAAIKGGGRGLSRHQLVTLASMIEKEAVVPAEKPLISSVFHNRLKLGMPLQSDPTAVYGVRAFGGKVTKADILRPSPYNTYLIKGLPPGPIGNPGEDALRAAAQPADSSYLYFVARKDGTHHFSKNLEEHNRAVRTYLR